MTGITHRIVTKSYTSLLWLVAIGIVLSCQTVMAVPVSLDALVFSPQPTITTSDEIIIVTRTNTEIDPGGGWGTKTDSLVINGFDIEWEVSSGQFYPGGAAVMSFVAKSETIGPLPAGTYNLSVNWLGYVPSHPGPLSASTQFTVIPEPATLALMSMAFMCVLGKRRQR